MRSLRFVLATVILGGLLVVGPPHDDVSAQTPGNQGSGGGLSQHGTITPGDVAVWRSSGVLEDGGAGGSGCTVSGSAGSVFNNGSNACATDTDVTFSSHTVTIGSAGIFDFSAASATAGLKVPAHAGAAPTTDGILSFDTTAHGLAWGSNGSTADGAAYNLAQTWSAAQTFDNSDILLLGSSTGATTFASANAGASNFTATFPANTGAISELNLAETWTAAQTFTNSDILLLGSSTGKTTFTSDNAGASNFTLHVPAANDTLADIAGTQTLTNKTLTSPTINAAALSGTLSGTPTFSGNLTFSGVPVMSGLSAGTQVSCMGLDSGNNVVLNAAACGSGSGGSWTLTDGSHSVSGVTQVTVTGGVVGGSTPNATLTISASAGGTSNQIQYNNSGALAGFTMGGDCTLVVGTGAITCTKTSGSAFVASATTDTTNASNISSGTLASARGGAGSINGALKGNGSGVVSQAACADLSNGAASCSTDTTNASNISSGSLALGRIATIATNTILGNNSGSTAVPSAIVVGAGLVSNSNGLQTTVPSSTKTANYTVAAADMGGIIYLNGTFTLTVPAISSTVLTTGMSVSYQNIGSGNVTLSSTPTINGLPSTTLVPGASGTLVGNGSSLDWTGFSTPTSTVIGGVVTKDCTSGGQFIQTIASTGVPTCASPAGGGTVSVVGSGTLPLHTVIVGGGTQLVTATATGTSGIALIGQGASADPIFGTVIPAGGGTGLTTITAHGIMIGEGTGNVAVAGPSSTSGALLASAGSSSDPAFDTNATVTAGALALGASGTAGSVAMGNATSGVITLQPVAGALGTVTASLPANAGTIAELNLAQTWSAVQTVTQSDLALLGSSTGKTTLNSGLSSSSNNTLTLPTEASDTLVDLTGTQTLTNKTLTTAALGSSTATTQSAKDNSTKVATTAYVDAPTGLTSGTSVTLAAPRQYFQCTSTCTITVPIPAAGYEFCVYDKPGTSGAITFNNPGSSVQYAKTDSSGYGTATTGTAVSTAAAGSKLCLLGVDSTHYDVGAYAGSWTMN